MVFLSFAPYVDEIVRFDYFYKYGCFVTFYPYGYMRTVFKESSKYDLYVFSRIFRNLRSSYYGNLISINRSFRILNKRGQFMASFFYFFIMVRNSVSYWSLFEYLLFNIYKVFSSYETALFLVPLCLNKKLKYFDLQWNDLYSRINDSYELMENQTTFLFKCDLPRLTFSFLNYFDFIFGMSCSKKIKNKEHFILKLVFYSFFGLDIFLRRRKFKYFFFLKFFKIRYEKELPAKNR